MNYCILMLLTLTDAQHRQKSSPPKNYRQRITNYSFAFSAHKPYYCFYSVYAQYASLIYEAAPQTKTVVSLLELFNGKFVVKHFAPVFILPDFLLCTLHFSITFFNGLRCFLFCHGSPFLLVDRRKEQPFSWLKITALG